jgi:hypothetical protein
MQQQRLIRVIPDSSTVAARQKSVAPHAACMRSAHNAHTVLCVQVFVGRCIRMRLTAYGSGYRLDVGAYRRGRYNCPVEYQRTTHRV